MKIYISVDMEGISGINSPEYVTRDGRLYGVGQRLMTADVNAAVRGAFDGGADEVIVADMHGASGNLLVEELDPRALSPEERRELRRQIALAHETEELRQTGALYRLLSPFEGNDTAWITVSPDRREALFLLVRDRAQANAFPPLVRLRGLESRSICIFMCCRAGMRTRTL